MNPAILALGALLFLAPAKNTKPVAKAKTTKASKSAKSAKAVYYPEFDGKRIFILGDSLSMVDGTPGGRLAKRLHESGASVEVNAIGGRSAGSFLSDKGNCDYPQGKKGPKRCDGGHGLDQLEDMVASFDPDIALIMLGTNDVANICVGGSKKAGVSSLKKIVDYLEKRGVKVIWIGPPAFPAWDQPHYEKRVAPFYGDLVKASEKLVPEIADALGVPWIDSRKLTSDLTSKEHRADGIHFRKGADKWAARLAEAVADLL